MEPSEAYLLSKLLFGSTRLLRTIKLGGVLRTLRSRAWWTFLAPFHEDLIFRMRTFGVALTECRNHPNSASYRAQEVCTESRRLMGRLLDMRDTELHCCWMLFAAGEDASLEYVETCARSRPTDARLSLLGMADRHPVSKNTVSCALLGRDDRHTRWKPLRCFATNDLVAHEKLFETTRTDWAQFYRSVLVFPLTYPDSNDPGIYETLGFLAFDSLRKDAFPGVPDVFAYRDRWTEYHALLAKSTAFQLGAIIADILAMFLRPAYMNRATTGGVNGQLSR